MTPFRCLLLAILTAGCPSQTDVSKKEEPDTGYEADTTTPATDTGCPDNGCLICTNGTCEIGVYMLTDEIVDCFWDAATGNWNQNAPDEIRGCPPNTDQDNQTALQDECWVILDVQQLEATNTCDCEDRGMEIGPADPPQGNGPTPATDPSGCCTWEENTDDASADALFAAFMASMSSACQVPTPLGWLGQIWSCSGRDPNLNEMVGPTWGESIWGGDCCGDDICLERAQESAYALKMDPLASFLQIDVTPLSQSFITRVRGAVTLDAAATHLLAGSAQVGDATLGGLTFDAWSFTFESPMGIEVQGNTTRITQAEATGARILGHGKVAIWDHAFTLTLDADVHGTLNFGAGRWSLEHTESSPSGTVTVHLEGPIAQLPQ